MRRPAPGEGRLIVLESFDANMQSRDDEFHGTVSEYLKRAQAACAEGDAVLGMHLYLAAFEEAMAASSTPSEDAIVGLKEAWALACNSKERSLAEYIFEKLEPFLDSDEVTLCAEELQKLALDKLEEFGLSRDELENVAEMISQDFLGYDAPIVKVEHIIERPIKAHVHHVSESATEPAADDEMQDATADAQGDAASQRAAAEAGTTGTGANANANADGAQAQKASEQPAAENGAAASASEAAPANRAAASAGKAEAENPMAALAKAVQDANIALAADVPPLDYRTLSGYDATIRTMRNLGIGLKGDAAFEELVSQLNARHGLDRMPALDTLLFRSPAREDANRFVAATIGELKLPVLRMHMEENLQGMPLLCVTAQAENASKLTSLRTAFDGGGILVLEDIDLWGAPLLDTGEEAPNFLMMQLSRGAREAINLVRSAVDNPEVYVLATASDTTEIDPFFLDLLEPISVVDIDYPTPEERAEIWMDIAREHPSLRGVNRADLVRLSANMPRYDMYMAAREAVEEAYKEGLVARHYRPVTRDNLFDKLAASQPLDSREYHELEDAVIRDFRHELEHIDDLLKSE